MIKRIFLQWRGLHYMEFLLDFLKPFMLNEWLSCLVEIKSNLVVTNVLKKKKKMLSMSVDYIKRTALSILFPFSCGVIQFQYLCGWWLTNRLMEHCYVVLHTVYNTHMKGFIFHEHMLDVPKTNSQKKKVVHDSVPFWTMITYVSSADFKSNKLGKIPEGSCFLQYI